VKQIEPYWTRKGPPTPEFHDLATGTFSGTEEGWESLSPGARRSIWREAIKREARERGLSDDLVFRVNALTIDGSLGSLDEYLMVIEREDTRRSSMAKDANRIARADAMHRQSEVQINARETL
jgi:hypothetical protein